MELSNWIALGALLVTVVLWWLERRSRTAQVERERADRRAEFEDERRRGEEQLRLFRLQVEADLKDREKEREKEQAAAREAAAIHRAPLRAGAFEVADELRKNAVVSKRCEEGSHVPEETRHLVLTQWSQRRGEMAGLRDEDQELWEELEKTYAGLEQSKKRGAHPPPSQNLLGLADRLAQAADGPPRSQPSATAR
jgi:hypothetical protein